MKKIESFNLKLGQKISNRYEVVELLGSGVEGEVYKVVERYTSKERAVKLFYPQYNEKFKSSILYCRKLDKLRGVSLVMDYLSHEVINLKSMKVACLVSEFIEGQSLDDFINKQRGRRMGIFPAIHLLYSIVLGVEAIHFKGEYHGDLHTENILIRKFGLEFDLKIIDLHHWGDSKKENREEDLVKIIRIFYDILGGSKHYSKLAPSVKYIICGLKRSLILKRFKTVSNLRLHLEKMDWSDAV